MKKQLTYLCLFICSGNLKSQTTNWILGGQNVSGNTSIGALDNYKVDFLTGGSPRFTVLSSGNMGIGTTAPLSKLDVNGGIAIGSYAGTTAAPTNGVIASGKIGTGLSNPAWQLDISGGDANVGKSSAAYGYRINDTMALWLPNLASGNYGYCTYVGRAGNASSIAQGATLVGCAAGRSITSAAPNCTFVGAFAGYKNTPGQGGTFVGGGSGYNNTTGDFNTFMGYLSGFKNDLGGNQVFIGYNAGYGATSGSFNVGVGAGAYKDNSIGTYNVAVGVASLNSTGTFSFTTAAGANSLKINTGSNNTAFGYNAGVSVNSGSDNTLIGYNANTGGANAATLSYASAIGSGATVTTNSTMILGDNYTNVGIGYSGGSLISNVKFNVKTSGTTISGGSNSYGSYSLNSNPGSGSFGIPPSYAFCYGAYGESNGSGNQYSYNYGGAFTANTGTKCIGVGGTCTAPGGSVTGALAYGGYFNATYSSTSTTGNAYGAVCYASNGAANYGVYASVSNVNGNYAGFFSGDVYVSGVNSGTGYLTVSDGNLKKSVADLSNASNIVKKLKAKSYYFDTLNNMAIYFPKSKQYGFLAQDLISVLPELVTTVKKPALVDANGKILAKDTTHLAVNYNGFIALLTSALQEQQSKIDSLSAGSIKKDSLLSKQDSINKALQDQINQIVKNCCNSGSGNRQANPGSNDNNSSSGNPSFGGAQGPLDGAFQNPQGATSAQINVQLGNLDIVVLNQNTPNPFAEQTTITYNIPKSVSNAQILFYDVNGHQIKTVDITKKGAGQLNVYANDLTNGIYSYTLIADGKIIDTKKMIKQQ